MNFLATRLRRIILQTVGKPFFPRPKDAPATPRSKEVHFLASHFDARAYFHYTLYPLLKRSAQIVPQIVFAFEAQVQAGKPDGGAGTI